MSTITDQECEQLCETQRIEDHEHDLIQELGRRLGYLWGYDRCIAHAAGRPELQEYWRSAKSDEQRNINRLKRLIKQHVQSMGS